MEEGNVFRLLVYSPNKYKAWNWARMKPGTQSFIQVFQMGREAHPRGSYFIAFPRCLSRKLEWWKWSSLTHYIATPALRQHCTYTKDLKVDKVICSHVICQRMACKSELIFSWNRNFSCNPSLSKAVMKIIRVV